MDGTCKMHWEVKGVYRIWNDKRQQTRALESDITRSCRGSI